MKIVEETLSYLERPLRGSDFCSDIGEMSEEVLDVPWYMKSETARTATVKKIHKYPMV